VAAGLAVAVGAVAAADAAEDADEDAAVGDLYGTPLVAHPVTVASRPTATARTVNRRRGRRATSRRASDDTGTT
jgi:hypothetical protein